jgi:hypothetical protein
MTTARAIVLMTAAACAGAAQTGGENLRAQIAATLQQVNQGLGGRESTTGCRTRKTICPDGFNATHGFCCNERPPKDRCYLDGKELRGYIECGNVGNVAHFQCSDIPDWPSKC